MKPRKFGTVFYEATDQKWADLADRRTSGITAAWFTRGGLGLEVLARSAYLQGCRDMATAIEHGGTAAEGISNASRLQGSIDVRGRHGDAAGEGEWNLLQ